MAEEGDEMAGPAGRGLRFTDVLSRGPVMEGVCPGWTSTGRVSPLRSDAGFSVFGRVS